MVTVNFILFNFCIKYIWHLGKKKYTREAMFYWSSLSFPNRVSIIHYVIWIFFSGIELEKINDQGEQYENIFVEYSWIISFCFVHLQFFHVTVDSNLDGMY